MEELGKLLENGTNLLLPMATVYETGNHIAQIGNGNQQRQFAEIFVDEVKKAISGDAPWTVMQVSTLEEVSEWLNEFPNSAMRGAGIADLSID